MSSVINLTEKEDGSVGVDIQYDGDGYDENKSTHVYATLAIILLEGYLNGENLEELSQEMRGE